MMQTNLPQGIIGSSTDTEMHLKRKISMDGELARYQWWLQKTLEEKRELQSELQAVKIQLVAVSFI